MIPHEEMETLKEEANWKKISRIIDFKSSSCAARFFADFSRSILNENEYKIIRDGIVII
mgnify:CR=1 FL=1